MIMMFKTNLRVYFLQLLFFGYTATRIDVILLTKISSLLLTKLSLTTKYLTKYKKRSNIIE